MTSLAAKTCVVTGATSGIGEATALALAKRGARVVLCGRSRERGERTRARLASEAGADAGLLLADLASLAEVRRLAGEILAACPRLDALVHNAGVFQLRRTTTADGFETTFAVNHLAPFVLTELLLPRLVESAPARIVIVASEAHRLGALDFDDLQNERWGAMRAYGRSKSANILFTLELARRLEGTGVTANCLHPGGVSTRLGHASVPSFVARAVGALLRPFLIGPERGAETSVHLVAAPELEGVSGRYFAKCREATPAPPARDPTAAKRLWEASAALTGAGG